MSDSAHNPDDYCYRHPDRLSFVLCERCGRTICLECQRHVGGRVLCPDDATEARPVIATRTQRFANRNRRRVRTIAARVPTGTPVVTYTIMGVIALLYIADLIAGGLIQQQLWYIPSTEFSQPWRVLTSMVSSGSGINNIVSVLGNLFVLFIVGTQLERTYGHRNFLLLYVISGAAAGLFALIFFGIVFGASEAIFGVIAAYAIVVRRSGGQMLWIYFLIAINVLSVLIPEYRFLLWQASLGGFVAGFAVAYVYLFEGANQRARQLRRGLAIAGVVIVVVAIAKTIILRLSIGF